MKKKSSSPSGFLSLRVITILFCATAACSVLTVPLLAFLRAQEQVNGSQRTLSFEERVSYQKAIEEVYWRHRIWPKERKDPRPSLDSVMSNAQVEKKVRDYLRNSQALEDSWQRPITAEQLQAEMDRIAAHTRQPEVLRELFEALGNDPFVIAECLARPALAERLITNWYAYDQRIHGGLRKRAEADLQAHCSVEQMKQMGGNYSEVEFVESEDGEREQHGHHDHVVRLGSHEWKETIQKLVATFDESHWVLPGIAPHQSSAGTPAHSIMPKAKYQALPLRQVSRLQEDETGYHAIAVLNNGDHDLKLGTVSWLKEPFESWRTRSESRVPAAIASPKANYMLPPINDGSECIVGTWTTTSGPPDGRYAHTAVWTGSEMIVWGGFTYCCSTFNTGGRYNPSTDNWTITSTANAPSARSNHTAVWTGSEMIVWGGSDGSNALNSGGRYNPDTDNWTATSTTNAPSARSGHTAIWSGSDMIVWGGYDPQGNTGGRYNPNTNSWGSTSTINAPEGRWNHTAVWTGTEMIVWGGENGGVPFNTGGKYNPGTNSWTPTSTNNVPDGREFHTAIWTASEMIVWGGSDSNTGWIYNPNTDSWAAISTNNAPSVRSSHTAVWTGSEMIVWGGIGFGSRYPNSGGRYNPVTNIWVPTGSTPNPRRYHTAVWTGTEMIVWGGALQDGGNPYSNTGGRYNFATDSWAATSTANAPSVRAYHTAVWTGSEMIIWGGFNFDEEQLNTGGRYDPATDSWTATSIVNAPSNRDSHTAVWTGTDMIVWGGYFYDGNDHFLNTGGKYDPDTDSWTATSLTNVPDGRLSHTAVWTGNEMIVWGGLNYDLGYLKTGGKYVPGINRWISTSITNAPEGRSGHTAAWTGNEMIVWGGYYLNGNFYYLNTGGGYNPGTDSWVATTTDNAPDARALHSAVWTGSEMIVWGGLASDETPYFDTGGGYDPSTNSWTATNISNAPPGRYRHTATWTGNEMIIWAGVLYTNTYTNTGARYCAQSGSPTPAPTPTATPRVTPRPRPTPRVRPTPH
jgi:N-acetylneuraminic acid mutarotase